MFDELKIYKNNGHFFFKPGQKLSDVCNAPEKPGVYIIYQLRKGKVELVYIGASGTINQKGKFSKQLLKGRLINGKQDGIPRQNYFEQNMLIYDIDALDIYWWVTFDEDNQHIPACIEGILLQRYFDINSSLPLWNKEF
jgi:hypothetical protein